jgi:hypothetical protein
MRGTQSSSEPSGEEKNLLPVSRIDVRFVGRPDSNQQLHLLRYPGSFYTIVYQPGVGRTSLGAP